MSEILGWFIGIPIGLGLGFALIKYVIFPLQERQFARELYGEDNLCKKQLHEPMKGDSRCMKVSEPDHCCHCENHFCKWEFAHKQGLLWWYHGQKRQLMKYIKKHNLTSYPNEVERKQLQKMYEDRQRQSWIEMDRDLIEMQYSITHGKQLVKSVE